jgi:hypothetical protein
VTALRKRVRVRTCPSVGQRYFLFPIFLFPNIASEHSVTYHLIRILRELSCMSWRTRSWYHDPSNSQFSAIISLFGTRSVYDPPSQFTSPLAQHMVKRNYQDSFFRWYAIKLGYEASHRGRAKSTLRTSEASLTALDVNACGGGEF